MGPATGPVVRLFMLELEAWIFKLTIASAGSGIDDDLAPDIGLEKIRLRSATDAKVLTLTDRCAPVTLSFAGRVTRCPKKGALHVCSQFGMDFYLVPEETSDLAASDTFVPAWAVPEKKGKNSASMELASRERTFTFTYRTLLKPEIINTAVAL
eukprot:169727-Pyramimonas_sp.AAC.1